MQGIVIALHPSEVFQHFFLVLTVSDLYERTKIFYLYFESYFNGLKYNGGPRENEYDIFSQNLDLIEHKVFMNNQVCTSIFWLFIIIEIIEDIN